MPDRSDRFIQKSLKGFRINNEEARGEALIGRDGIALAGGARAATAVAAGVPLSRAVTPSRDLAAITGADPLPRSQVVSKVWDYIRRNSLQNPDNKREILADDKLKKIFGSDRVSMFEMNKHLSRHLS